MIVRKMIEYNQFCLKQVISTYSEEPCKNELSVTNSPEYIYTIRQKYFLDPVS